MSSTGWPFPPKPQPQPALVPQEPIDPPAEPEQPSPADDEDTE